MKCTKRSKRSGEQCRRDAMIGRDCCYMHGGATPRGTALPQTKHGRYSKSVPVRLAARYEEALADPELLSLREEAALVSSQIHDTLARMERGETGGLWLDLQKAWARMTEAKARGDVAGTTDALNDVGALIRRGASDAAANRELRGVILDKARVAESERKRLVEAQQVLSVQQAMAFVGAVTAVVAEEVTDRDTRARIADALDRLLVAGSPE